MIFPASRRPLSSGNSFLCHCVPAFVFVSLRDELILKAAGAPRRPSFFCMPKRKKAKKRAPCFRGLRLPCVPRGLRREKNSRSPIAQTPFRSIRSPLRYSARQKGTGVDFSGSLGAMRFAVAPNQCRSAFRPTSLGKGRSVETFSVVIARQLSDRGNLKA